MKKKPFHKNSKRAVSPKKKQNKQKGSKKYDLISIVNRVILALYLSFGFLKGGGAFDVAFTQWYYVSILNTLSLGFIFYNKDYYKFEFHNKTVKYVFLGALVFVFLSLISITKSISISESIVFLNILLTTLITFFTIYLIVKDRLEEYFSFIAYVLMIVLTIDSLQVIDHFMIKNGNQPRSNELFLGLNPTYGNRNILAASLVIKTAFTLYIVFTKNRLKYILGLLTMFIAITAILLVGARTAIYSLPVIFLLLLTGNIYVNKNENFLVQIKKYFAPTIVIVSTSIFCAVSINKIHKGKLNTFSDLVFVKEKKDLYKEGENSVSYASDSGRKFFWEAAIDGFQSSPLRGVGIGNWKLIEKEELVKSIKNSNHFYPRRVHNDFLQVLSEIGILGFLLFISLFVVVYYLLLKVILKKRANQNRKLLALICLAAFVAYSLDSLINFPSERTPIQLLGFVLIVIALCVSSNQNKPIKIPLYFKIIILLIGVLTVYLNNQIFTSSKYQLLIRKHIRGKNILTSKYKIGYDQMNNVLTDFPTMNGMGQPMDYAKAVLAYSEGKYAKTFEHLDKAIEVSPYSLEHYGFKALIYNNNKTYKNFDSAFYYAKKVLDKRPSMINQYNIVRNYYKAKNDTVNLLKTINVHLNSLPKGNERVWFDKINFYLKYKKNLEKATEVMDSAKLLNPEKEKIQAIKLAKIKNENIIVNKNDSAKIKKFTMQQHLNTAVKLFSIKNYGQAKNEFSKALSYDKKNYDVLLNLAVTEIKLKNYKKAIEHLNEVIASGQINTGKPEYNRGFCYLKFNKKKEAGIDFRTSLEKGFPLAKKVSKKILAY
ncbi:O-antigen ligase family protein [Tenacibaculum amylolyticum]|uniref:O-antigen ligase family protein n=1 Tax=Tenacibaculum amylolyticum TaxID=104269 RepID=UPI0038964F26